MDREQPHPSDPDPTTPDPRPAQRSPRGNQTIEVLDVYSFLRYTAEIQEVADDGLELLCPERIEPGTMLYLGTPAGKGANAYQACGEVTDATRHPDGNWLINFHIAPAFV